MVRTAHPTLRIFAGAERRVRRAHQTGHIRSRVSGLKGRFIDTSSPGRYFCPRAAAEEDEVEVKTSLQEIESNLEMARGQGEGAGLPLQH